MRKISFLLGLLMLALSGQVLAQTSQVYISGTITDQSGQPIPNQWVVAEFGGNQGFQDFDSIQANVNGFFDDTTFVTPPQTGYILVWVSVPGCNPSYMVDTAFFDSSAYQSYTFNFQTNCNAPPTCVASFSHQTSGTGLVTFTNLSQAPAGTSYFWDMGDGSTMTGNNVSYLYGSPGTYTACLYLNNSTTGCFDSTCQTIVIPSQTCTANLYAGSLGNGEYLFVADSSQSNPGTVYVWDFGDGTVSTTYAANTTYQYAVVDSYQVCLTVIDSSINCTATDCELIYVNTVPNTCVANFDYQTTFTGALAFFNTSQAPAGAVATWDMGDGTVMTGNNFVYSYNSTGTYQVCMYISNPATGCQDSICKNVFYQAAQSCNASFAAIQTTTNGDFTFFADSSTNNPGTLYQWDFGDGNTAVTTAPYISNQYTQPGSYMVCLAVTDTLTGCMDSTCQLVTYSNVPTCSADFIFTQIGAPGSYDVQFINTSIPQDTTQYQAVHWYFGDGTLDNQSKYMTYHTYPGPGTYFASLYLQTTSGCVDTVAQVITLAGSGCAADFSWDSSGLTVDFTNLSTGSNPAGPLDYYWYFGDSTGTSTQMSPTYTYSQPGTYFVCLAITDSLTGCTDQICEMISVGVTGGNTCIAEFIPTPLGNQTFVFQALAYGQPYTYTWNFGDGTGDSIAGPLVHYTYSQPGQYNVCLTLADTANNCADTVCYLVDATAANPTCSANFVWSQTATGAYQFTNLSTSQDSNATSYFWEFGDSTFSTAANPSKTYNGPGPWVVCLTVTDSSTGCMDFTCQVVGDSVNLGLSISGLVLQNGLPALNGIAYLIEHDSAAGTLTLIDSTFIGGSYYHFQNVQPGTYLVKAALLPGSPGYSSFLPTYLGDELFWDDAISTIVGGYPVVNPSINLILGNNPGGPGFIGGLVSQGANKKGDPMTNVSILLLDADYNPVTHVATDANGEFILENLAYGTYHVFVEMPGAHGEHFTVTLSADNPSHSGVEFEVSDNQITVTGLDLLSSVKGLTAYPNPTESILNVSWNQVEMAEAHLTLRNALGQEMMRRDLGRVAGQVEETLSLDQLPAGIYLLEVGVNGERQSLRITRN